MAVKAIVRVILDIESDSVWGDSTSWKQVVDDAEIGVKNVLSSGNDLALKGLIRRIRSVEMVEARVVKN